MKCSICNEEFEEKDIQESHDVPCYLFEGNRNIRKQQADKFLRRWLCAKCHKGYELRLRIFLRDMAKEFAIKYFGDYNGE